MTPAFKFPKTQTAYYAMRGGLNLVTSALKLDPGNLFDCQNYEPDPVSGYSRIKGYERSDGRPSPSAASYWVVTVTTLATISVGQTVTGLTSGASGKVLLATSTLLVLGRVTGTYVTGESLQVGGITKATATSGSLLNGASAPSDHADYRLLAANDRRADIQAITGSGPIRGGFTYGDVVFAFRDNVGGTAGNLWKQTAGGWVQVTFGQELQFTGATGQIFDAQTITGASSGATATVVRAMLRTGTWSSAGVGTLILTAVTGTFTNGENIQVGGVTKVVASGTATNITRAPGGRVEYVIDNFTGLQAGKKVYGADGVNLGFEFDGINYIPIRTGMAADTPSHVIVHRFYLMYSFQASHQISSLGQPYQWSVVTGAAEIATGENITGYQIVSGNNAGAALAMFARNRTYILYGSASSGTGQFQLIPSTTDMGYSAYTAQSVGNDIYGLTPRGVQSLQTTRDYGDFLFGAKSFLVQPLLNSKAGMEVASTTLGAKNQYRLYFTDGTALVFGLTGDKISGILLLNYGKTVRCIWTETLSTGQEVTYFGSDDGYVYRDNIGTSFDGAVIPAWIRPAFNNLQSPQVRKTFRSAVFEVACEGYSQVNIGYDLNYANGLAEQAAPQADQALTGAGAYWDSLSMYWDQFTWDSPIVSNARISMDGNANNASFAFFSSRAQDDAHTVQGVTLLYLPRRLVLSGS